MNWRMTLLFLVAIAPAIYGGYYFLQYALQLLAQAGI